jgi:hypothetical protein
MTTEQINLISDDEAATLMEVADDARSRLAQNGTPPDILKTQRFRRSMRPAANHLRVDLVNYLDPGTISRDDLIVIAPYIDDWLGGNAPLFDLPAEYDRRLEFLGAFKKRMLSLGSLAFWRSGNTRATPRCVGIISRARGLWCLGRRVARQDGGRF